MNDYIDQLIESSETPQISHLRKIKSFYKRNADLICRINATFSLIMSTFFVVLFVSIVRDCIYSFTMILSYKAFYDAMTNDLNTVEFKLLKDMVRCVSADILIIIFKVTIIGFTFMQMVAVNDESRAIPVKFNDLMTQFNHEISTSLYHSVSYIQLKI